jgi:hypothetical protein
VTTQHFSQTIGVLVIVYLGLLLFISDRLKKFHATVWTQLGRPSLLNWSIANSFRLGNFVFLQRSYRSLDDTTLRNLIFGVRTVLIVISGCLIIWVTKYRGT